MTGFTATLRVQADKEGASEESVGQGDWVVITLDGEIDLARADDLARLIPAEWNPKQNLLVDLGAVSYMDSTGLNWLLNCRSKVTSAGGDMRLIVFEGGMVERILELVGLHQIFPVYRTIDKALDRLSEPLAVQEEERAT